MSPVSCDGPRADYEIDLHELALASPDGRAIGEQAGVMFALGVMIDGQLFSSGRLSERKLRRQLDREGQGSG